MFPAYEHPTNMEPISTPARTPPYSLILVGVYLGGTGSFNSVAAECWGRKGDRAVVRPCVQQHRDGPSAGQSCFETLCASAANRASRAANEVQLSADTALLTWSQRRRIGQILAGGPRRVVQNKRQVPSSADRDDALAMDDVAR